MQVVIHDRECVANRKTRSKIDFLRVYKSLDHGQVNRNQAPGCQIEYELRVHRTQEFLIRFCPSHLFQ